MIPVVTEDREHDTDGHVGTRRLWLAEVLRHSCTNGADLCRQMSACFSRQTGLYPRMQADKQTEGIMAVYGYVRVSTARMASDGESLDVQQRTVAGYAMMHALEVSQIFVEGGVSGSVPLGDRPQGKALLAALRAGDVVITAKLDRMFRSALDALGVLADLKERGVSLHMIDLGGDVTGNGISKLVFTILSAVAEAERDRIRERISVVKADQKARGAYLGGYVPFGYAVGDGQLVPVAEQQAVIERIVALRGEGKSLRAIKAALNLDLSLDAIARIARG
jgi:putative DNA-invertase from lambdoid prophage Rac